MKELRPRWSPLIKIAVSLMLTALCVFLLYRFSIILKPLILAVILAYILSPLVDFLHARLRIFRVLAELLSYLFLIVIITALSMVIIPPLANQLSGLNLDIQRIVAEIRTFLVGQYTIFGQVIDVGAMFQQVVGSLQGILEPLFGQTLSFALDVISSLVWVVFILVISFYLIKDWEKLSKCFEGLVPPAYISDFLILRGEIDQIWSAFFRGQLVLALVVASIFTVTGFILGLPFAFAMGVLAGLLEFFPSIGHTIWLITASTLALFVGSTWMSIPKWSFMLILIGLHLVFQQFDLNYLIPRIIGRRVHLPPLLAQKLYEQTRIS